MKFYRSVAATVISLLFSQPSQAQEPQEILLCTMNTAMNTAISPFVNANTSNILKDRPGTTLDLVWLAGKHLNKNITVTRLPWKRCMSKFKMGSLDRMVFASFKPSQTEIGVYPMTGGRLGRQLDNSRRIITISYSLYRRKGTTPTTGGENITGIEGYIGSPRCWNRQSLACGTLMGCNRSYARET